ncbi:MAG: tetratricopeptide repeat protein [Candidatus Omnitrophica bacterium]|nr:tetratricopeptide repeat protein [Candidatus Omnitrophota bacterium]
MPQRILLSIRKKAIPTVFFFSLLVLSACSEKPQDVRVIDVNPLLAEGKLEEAAQEITRALAEYPNNVDLLYNLASIQRLQEKLDTARATLTKALSIKPDDDDANFLLTEILIQIGKVQEAWDRFHMLSDMYRRRPLAQYTLGVIHARLGNWQNAEGCFRAAVELGDKTAAAKSALAFVTCKQGRLNEGRAYLTEAETADDPTPAAMSQMAESYLILEQVQKARDIARQLTQRYPSDAHYWALLGRTEMKLLNFADSESAFTRALTCPNANPWVQIQYAEMLYASHREDEALAQATDAETQISRMNLPILNPSLYNLLAALYAKNDQMLLAQRFLNRSLQIDPTQPRIREILQKLSAPLSPDAQQNSESN